MIRSHSDSSTFLPLLVRQHSISFSLAGKAVRSQLTRRCVPALADAASFAAARAPYTPQLQGSARSHETNDTPLPHTQHSSGFSTPPSAFLLKQGYLFFFFFGFQFNVFLPLCRAKRTLRTKVFCFLICQIF